MLIKTIVDELEIIPQAHRESIRGGEKSVDIHRHHMTMNGLTTIEKGGEVLTPPSDTPFAKKPLRTIAWNLERCLDVDNSADLLRTYDADVILLSEMDNGMARTQQRHTTRELAEQLDMFYLYGVEFVELDLGNPTEQALATDQHNQAGWHGNAILSRWPIANAAMLRLDDHGHWFQGQNVCGVAGQPRVGGRMALFATLLIDSENNASQPLTVVSTHLESNGGDLIQLRGEQINAILQALHDFGADDHAIVIGGDLNTGNNLENPANWQIETLFAVAENAGFHWNGSPAGVTVRPSKLTLEQQYDKRLDWFCARGLTSQHAKIIPALAPDDTPLSDHELILSDWQLAQ